MTVHNVCVCVCVCTLRALHSVARVKINAAILSSVRIPPLGYKECNSIKCSFGEQGGRGAAWVVRDCLSLGGSGLPGAITGNLSHFRESGERFRACNGNFEVGLRGFSRSFAVFG